MEIPPRQPARRHLRFLIGAGALVMLAVVAWGSFLLGRASALQEQAAASPTRPAPAIGATSRTASQPTFSGESTPARPTSSPHPTAPARSPTAPSTATPSPTSFAAPAPTVEARGTALPAAGEAEALELEMIAVINQLRRENGCEVALQRSPELTAAARKHSRDMAENHFFDHRGSDGSDRLSRASAAEYVGVPGTRVRENIGAGQAPAEVAGYWMNLGDVHRSQILDCAYNEIGAGYALGDGDPYTHYWTVNFGVGPR